MKDLWIHAFRECVLTGRIALEGPMISTVLLRSGDESPPGKLLVQLVDPARVLRIDLFRAFGASISLENA